MLKNQASRYRAWGWPEPGRWPREGRSVQYDTEELSVTEFGDQNSGFLAPVRRTRSNQRGAGVRDYESNPPQRKFTREPRVDKKKLEETKLQQRKEFRKRKAKGDSSR